MSDLTHRVRALLADAPVTRELSMFGGRAFMINNKLALSALKTGGLLLRVPADHHATYLAEPGAIQPEMGAGRSMGPGWIKITPDALRDDRTLASWVEIALEHNRSVAQSPRSA